MASSLLVVVPNYQLCDVCHMSQCHEIRPPAAPSRSIADDSRCRYTATATRRKPQKQNSKQRAMRNAQKQKLAIHWHH
jgi:hypothetical protein